MKKIFIITIASLVSCCIHASHNNAVTLAIDDIKKNIVKACRDNKPQADYFMDIVQLKHCSTEQQVIANLLNTNCMCYDQAETLLRTGFNEDRAIENVIEYHVPETEQHQNTRSE